MPQEPKKKHSKQRKGKRRAHIKITLPALFTCSSCGKLKRPHIVCIHCGYYDGKKVLRVASEKKKKTPTHEEEGRSKT